MFIASAPACCWFKLTTLSELFLTATDEPADIAFAKPMWFSATWWKALDFYRIWDHVSPLPELRMCSTGQPWPRRVEGRPPLNAIRILNASERPFPQGTSLRTLHSSD